MQLHPLSGALPHDGSVSLPTGCPFPPWLIQVCQDISLRTLHHLLSTQLPIPQGPGKVSGSPSGLWKHSGSLFPHVFLPLSGEALAAALPRTPYPAPGAATHPNTPGAEYTNLALLSCPHSISACPATQTRKPCMNCWPSTGTSKHPTWSFQWLVAPKTSPWSHACARSSAGWFILHSLKVR